MSDSRYSNNTYEYIKAKRSVKYSELKIMEAKYSSKALSNTTEIKKQVRIVVGEKARAWNLLMKIFIMFKCIKTLIFGTRENKLLLMCVIGLTFFPLI